MRHRRPGHEHPDITAALDRIADRMDQLMTNQEHLDTDVTAISASVATAVAELKAAIAAGTPAEALDFTALDALAASTAAEAAADAPPVVEPPTV